ncbi:MAG: helix-turn-helix domain-containing protein [Pontibacterium sp.]
MKIEKTSYSAVLGVVLNNQRKMEGIEQGEMAERMGLSQASYSRLESGKSSFSVDQMYQAAVALGIKASDLTEALNDTVERLRESGVEVVPQVRGNTTQAKSSAAGDVGKVLAGATLGAVLITLLSKR